MSNPQAATWQGGSRRQYTFWVYQLPANLNSGQAGNYIFTKIVNGVWVPVYIGEGELSERTGLDIHHQRACLIQKGATHVHAHKNDVEQDRKAEETDLLAGNPDAYRPTGCNERLGG